MDFALPIAIVLCAGLAWDVARRYFGQRQEETTIDALRREVKELRERNDAQVKNALKEVHELLQQHDQKQAGVIAATAGNQRTRLRMRTG